MLRCSVCVLTTCFYSYHLKKWPHLVTWEVFQHKSLSAPLTYITFRRFGVETHGLREFWHKGHFCFCDYKCIYHSVVPETHHCLPDVSLQSSLWDLRSTERKCTCMAAKFFCSCEGAWWTNRSQLAWRGLLASKIYNTSPLLPRTWNENNNHTSCQKWTTASSPVDMWSERAGRSLRHPILCMG